MNFPKNFENAENAYNKFYDPLDDNDEIPCFKCEKLTLIDDIVAINTNEFICTKCAKESEESL